MFRQPIHKYPNVLAFLAYSLIGVKRYDEAIELLNRVKTLRGDRNLNTWQAVALAYSSFKTNKETAFKEWLS